MGFIYKITHRDGRAYIGQARDYKKRWKQHVLSDEQMIGRAITYYGRDCFHFELIEKCDNQLMNSREQYWIDYYDTTVTGFNCIPGKSNTLKLWMTDDEITYRLDPFYTPKGYFDVR